MSYSVLRKFLSTTSLVAVSAALAACSGDVERFGSPAFAGYSSGQEDILTNSIGSPTVTQPVLVAQPMPTLPAVAASDYNAQVYAEPVGTVYAPTVRPTARRVKVAQSRFGANHPVPPALIPGGSNVYAPQVSQPAPVPVYQPAPVYNRPVAVYQPAPIYQSAPTYQPVTPVQVPVAVQPSYGYRQPVVQPDYLSTSSIGKPSVLAMPPVVISQFHSMPKVAPRRKSGVDPIATASIAPRVTPPNAVNQPLPPMPQLDQKPVVISRFYSLPKNAPRRKNVDYTSTASIKPGAGVPTPGASNSQSGRLSAGQSAQVASVAPISLDRNQTVRTSGQWTSAGGSMVTARPGDDIVALSRRYGVPAKAIADVNGLATHGFIAAGQQVLIPVYQQQGQSSRSQVASLPAQGNYAVPSVIRTPKANPLRLQSRTPYGQEMIKLQQTANADRRHMVMPGDTLTGIARRYNVTVASLAGANRMDVNAPIRMGQRLHIPAARITDPGIDYTSTASINRTNPVNLAASAPQVTSGLSSSVLSSIPKSKPRQLVSNSVMPVVRISNDGPIAALPKAKVRRKVASLSPRDGSSAVKVDAGHQVVDIPTGDPAQKAKPVASGEPKFRWPVRGRIISSFGRKRDGGRNDGINLAVPAGTSVRVAESGTVIYAGDKLKGYGNLVLVQHSNGWVTAYAHNERLLVSKGQQVRRGQIIGQAGKTGEVDSPQVHFELRIKGDPVDPVPYLVSS